MGFLARSSTPALIASLLPHTCLVWSQIYPCYCPPCPHYFSPAGSIPRESLNPYCFKNTTTRSQSRQDLLGRYDAQKELKISVASRGPEYQNLEGDTGVNVYQMEAWVWKGRETLCRVQTAFIQQSLSYDLAPSHCKFFLLPERIPKSHPNYYFLCPTNHHPQNVLSILTMLLLPIPETSPPVVASLHSPPAGSLYPLETFLLPCFPPRAFSFSSATAPSTASSLNVKE